MGATAVKAAVAALIPPEAPALGVETESFHLTTGRAV